MTKKINKKEKKLVSEVDIFGDIFDLEYTKDLPKEIISMIHKEPKITLRTKILELFSIKDTLTVTEIICGLYRKHDIIKKKSHIYYALHDLIGTVQIVRKSVSTYEKVKVNR